MEKKQRIAVLTGAGISAESGLGTFRDSGGLWEKYKISEVATPEAWSRNPKLVLDFYNARRRQCMDAEPNAAHKELAAWESDFEVDIITQNVDDLHERAGSTKVLHLHGELLKVRSTVDPSLIYYWPKDLNLGDLCDEGSQLRPHIVWFGEEVPMLSRAAALLAEADVVVVVGSSMQVYPAAGLVGMARPEVPVFYVDPRPMVNYELSLRQHLEIISEPATVGVRLVREQLEMGR